MDLISEGSIEDERQVDLRRCEKISWPRSHIENALWTEVIRSEQRIHIWNEHDSYLVVLSQRNGYFLLWTAYLIDKEYQKNKLNKRWEKNK